MFASLFLSLCAGYRDELERAKRPPPRSGNRAAVGPASGAARDGTGLADGPHATSDGTPGGLERSGTPLPYLAKSDRVS